MVSSINMIGGMIKGQQTQQILVFSKSLLGGVKTTTFSKNLDPFETFSKTLYLLGLLPFYHSPYHINRYN